MLLLIDSNMLGYVAKYACGSSFSINDIRRSNNIIIFFFLKKVLDIAEYFKSNKVVFAWDSRKSLRRIKYLPTYKMERAVKREHESPDEKELHKYAIRQFNEIRKNVLPSMGFKNVFLKTGYEGDDIIASISKTEVNKEDRIIMVARDHDLYQLINSTVDYYDPVGKKLITNSVFKKEYGIDAYMYSVILPITGCKGDNVNGVYGVKSKTAIKYINGELRGDSKKAIDIREAKELIEANKKLVILPFEGTPKYEINKDKLTVEKLMSTFEKYELRSFIKDFKKWQLFIDGFDDSKKTKRNKKGFPIGKKKSKRKRIKL